MGRRADHHPANAAVAMILDGRFPAGGHTYSAGVEAAVSAGDISNDETLERYLAGRLATTGLTDAAFAAHVSGLDEFDRTWLSVIDAEYDARTLSPALRAASRRFGRQLLRVGGACWEHPAIDAAALPGGAHQPIALGAVVAAAGGSPTDAAQISLHHLSAAVTSSAIRLLGLDPIGVAAIQARACVAIDGLVASAVESAQGGPANLPALGGALTDILAEDHQRWDSRMFVA